MKGYTALHRFAAFFGMGGGGSLATFGWPACAQSHETSLYPVLTATTPLKFYCAPGRGNYPESGTEIKRCGISYLAGFPDGTGLTYRWGEQDRAEISRCECR